jgi:hypothetical protein
MVKTVVFAITRSHLRYLPYCTLFFKTSEFITSLSNTSVTRRFVSYLYRNAVTTSLSNLLAGIDDGSALSGIGYKIDWNCCKSEEGDNKGHSHLNKMIDETAIAGILQANVLLPGNARQLIFYWKSAGSILSSPMCAEQYAKPADANPAQPRSTSNPKRQNFGTTAIRLTDPPGAFCLFRKEMSPTPAHRYLQTAVEQPRHSPAFAPFAKYPAITIA